MRSKLTEEAAAALLAARPGWLQDEGDSRWISKRYRFGSFPEAVAFVGEVARIAEEEEHHPLIAIDYKVVTLRLTTWSAGGLTRLDFTVAERFDEAFAVMRP
ncbi:4a-hydroxytetrahydrobiopterin dehydratase [Paenibacillus sp. UNCCL117]|uniref:4a-hydroxytetrahydrobiopterin dehydratase n=1 Tax=unclassified Paenibacillus TaxID=185978 RepID=UPI00088EE77F|nr:MULTISPECIES: 4a-hydroxytetrahydrobiopterin dehydratase [unclassified Paenibacillus]SDD16363.1 pterin-4-alpha-carbinolamine dehydratase [Paenibacillus sp. cl123]SFW34681.1 4a-hydroxytetrahydrobiopterin dehydratase [Paenibacillus sp. UNCCL117]